MNRILGAPLAVLLLAVASRSLAYPFTGKYSISGSEDDSRLPPVASQLRDLLPAGNSPSKIVDGKKHMKNSAGKSDEGGFYKTYGSDADGEKGYLKQTYSKGDHGYKTLDTFHKKDGDNYGFEEHTAFGKARGRDKGGKAGKSGSYAATKGTHLADHEGAGTIVDTHYAEEDDEGAESGEASSYSEGNEDDDGEHYNSEGDSGRYSEGDPEAGNYGNSDGYNEEYSNGGAEEGSYGSTGSYSSDGEGAADYY